MATTKGQCQYCEKVFAKQSAVKHIKECSIDTTGKTACFLIKVQGSAPLFWQYILVPESCTLVNLDDFLRNIWLECCGHLSLFNIGGQEFYNSPSEPGDKSFDSKLKKLLSVGSQFTYEYDFGSTTELFFEVVDLYKNMDIDDVTLLMINELPSVGCPSCQKNVALICSSCQSIWCETCSAEDECGEDYFLPFVNSPRVGQCAYTGNGMEVDCEIED